MRPALRCAPILLWVLFQQPIEHIWGNQKQFTVPNRDNGSRARSVSKNSHFPKGFGASDLAHDPLSVTSQIVDRSQPPAFNKIKTVSGLALPEQSLPAINRYGLDSPVLQGRDQRFNFWNQRIGCKWS